ncbi:hypothetical protein BGX29_007474 [Mortierella sp. GBA35]|nr:hypothetical protein BGX29_007474 [Mortierella sp. GBA35]
MTDEDKNQTSAILSYMMQSLKLPSASSSATPNPHPGQPASSANVQSHAPPQQNIVQRPDSYGTSSLYLTDYEQHTWLGRRQLQSPETGTLNDQGTARADTVNPASASASFRPETQGTPKSNHRRLSLTDSGFMPWSQDIIEKESFEPRLFLEGHQSVSQEAVHDQDLHTPLAGAGRFPGMRETHRPSYSTALLQGSEEATPGVLRPAPVPPTPQNQGFFSPSPTPSDYATTRALLGLGLGEPATPSSPTGYQRPLLQTDTRRYSDDSSPLGIYFKERSQSADRMSDPGLPTRFLKVSNVDRKMSIWVARDAFKNYGDLRGIFTSFLQSDGVIFLEFFDIRHAMIASKRLYSSPAFENSPIKVHFCPISLVRQVLPEMQSNGNEGILVVSLQAPILTDNDLLRFLSSFGEIRSFQKEFSGWPPMALVEYYDVRHAASALSMLQEMHNNKRIHCQVAFYQKSPPIEWQLQRNPPIGYRMTRSSSTPGVVLHSSSGAGQGVDSSRSAFQAECVQSGSTLQRHAEQTLRTLSSTSDSRGSAHPNSVGGVTETSAKDEPSRLRRTVHTVQTQKHSFDEHSNSPPSQTHTTTSISNTNTDSTQKDVVIPLAPSDKRTTFMIRNIPNKYTQQMLLECINETHFGEFDFLYLRMDFKNKCNVGYAFINFINTEVVASFVKHRVGKRWGRFNSDKICGLSYATIQGRRALVEKFRNSSVMEEEPSYRPKIFYTSGPNLGQEEPFPAPNVNKEAGRGRRRISSDS